MYLKRLVGFDVEVEIIGNSISQKLLIPLILFFVRISSRHAVLTNIVYQGSGNSSSVEAFWQETDFRHEIYIILF